MQSDRTPPARIPSLTEKLFALPLVIVESPFAGPTPGTIARNLRYARMAIRDCITKGESPIASHLLYTQDGILLDTIPEERELGILCGYAWLRVAHKAVFYIDLGYSPGMEQARQVCENIYLPIEERRLAAWDTPSRG